MFTITPLFSLVLFVAVLNGSSGKVAPSFIKICPGMKSDCLKKVVQETLPLFSNGVPELGIKSIDPLRTDYVGTDLPGILKVEIYNATMTGLKECTVDSVSYKNYEVDVKSHCDLIIKGSYKANGRILIVNINGDGNAKIKIKNTRMHGKIKFHDIVRDGVVYHEVKSIDINQDYGEKITFSLTNLFKGNPELSKTVLQFMNENWKEIAAEFGKPILDKLIDIVYAAVRRFFEVVPKDELIVE